MIIGLRPQLLGVETLKTSIGEDFLYLSISPHEKYAWKQRCLAFREICLQK